MVSIVTKKIHGKEYIYLVHSVRKKNKVIQKTIKYIGKKRQIPKEEFACMEYSFKKEDWFLNDFIELLSYQDHASMKKASKEYKKYLQILDSMSKEKEKEKFLSIFISNSNAIEGSTMTPKETFNFLFNGIVPTRRTKKELHMATNLLKAWKYVEKNNKRFPTKEDLCQLHKYVNDNIEEEKTLGKYKKVQNYIGNIYTSSYLFTEERMKSLLIWIKKAFRKIDDFEVAFQSHAQFEIIHPFVDGNGRVGRLLLNWLLQYKGQMPLAIHQRSRRAYINALENARRGSLEPICKFCYKEYINYYNFL